MNLTKIEKIFLAVFVLGVGAFLVVEFVPFDNNIKRPVDESPVVEEKKAVKVDEIVNTEEVNEPVEEKTVEGDKPVVDADVADKDLIKSYYDKLASKDLEGAYKMKYDTKKVTFAQFKAWYGNVLFADVTDIVKKSEHNYQFTVYLREDKKIEEKYMVTMEVKDELLNTLSTEKTWDNYTPEFYTAVNGKIRTLYIKKDGVEKVVATVDENQYKYVYSDYKISDNNKYLMYTILGDGWGYRAVHVYDIDNAREVNLIYGPQDYGFTPDYKYFYQCSGMGESSGEFNVFAVPAFNKVYSAGVQITGCKAYNKDMNAYFLVVDWQKNIPRTYYFKENIMK